MFLFNRIVKILNRGTYTSGKKAASYCGRGLAEMVSRSEINMLEAAELSALKSEVHRVQANNQVEGKFAWYVGDSGGSVIMKAGTSRGTRAGVSGGHRVLKASHGVL